MMIPWVVEIIQLVLFYGLAFNTKFVPFNHVIFAVFQYSVVKDLART